MTRLASRLAVVAALVIYLLPAASRVVGSSRSDVYHVPDCRHALRIAAQNLVAWRSPADARADGYRACRVCTPAEHAAP